MAIERAWLNYHHLYYFRTIATEGGIAKAAKKLRLGQPTLSTQLKQFEDNLGHALFERRKKRLYLTEAGRIALNYANEIFRLGDELQDALMDRLRADRIEFQIGSLDTIPKLALWRLYQEAQSFRGCVASVVEGTSDYLFRELRAHRLDLLLTNHPPPVGESLGKNQSLYTRLLGQFPVMICGGKNFAKLNRNFPESLAEQPFLMPSAQNKLRPEIEQFFRSHNLRVDIVAEIQDSSLLRLMVASGAGLAAFSQHSVEDMLAAKEIFSLGEIDNVHEEFWLVAGERRIQNPVAAHLMKNFRL